MLLLDVRSLWFTALLALACPCLGPDRLGPAVGTSTERVGGIIVAVVLVVVHGGGARGRGSVTPASVDILITHTMGTSHCPVPGTVASVHGIDNIGGSRPHTCPHVARVTISVVSHRVGCHCCYLVQGSTDLLRQTLLGFGWLMLVLVVSITGAMTIL